jgi:hypothetical protein
MVAQGFENRGARGPEDPRQVPAPTPLQSSSWIFRGARPGRPRMVLPHV